MEYQGYYENKIPLFIQCQSYKFYEKMLLYSHRLVSNPKNSLIVMLVSELSTQAFCEIVARCSSFIELINSRMAIIIMIEMKHQKGSMFPAMNTGKIGKA